EQAQNAPPAKRSDDRLPPIDMRVGTEVGGSVGAADMTRMKELADYEKQRRPAPGSVPPPDPHVLARIYLTKAGFALSDLDAAGPALKAAAENLTLEKQLNAAPPPMPDLSAGKDGRPQPAPQP